MAVGRAVGSKETDIFRSLYFLIKETNVRLLVTAQKKMVCDSLRPSNFSIYLIKKLYIYIKDKSNFEAIFNKKKFCTVYQDVFYPFKAILHISIDL